VAAAVLGSLTAAAFLAGGWPGMGTTHFQPK